MSLGLYFSLYWILVGFGTTIASLLTLSPSRQSEKCFFLSFSFIGLFLILVPSRPICPQMADTVVYAANFYSDNFSVYEVGFRIIGNLCHNYFSLYSFFFLIALITLCNIIFSIRNIDCKNFYILTAGFLSSLIAWTTFHNALRQGLSLSMAFVAISLWNKNKKKSLLFLVLAILFHNSAIFFFAAAVGVMFIKELKFYWGIWAGAFIFSLFNISEKILPFFSNINPKKFELYTSIYDESSYNVGFRIDFIAYSLIPFLVYYLTKKHLRQDEVYLNLLKWYILLNAFWLFCVRLPFSDRFALPSWLLFSTLIIYPLLKSPVKRDSVLCSIFLIMQLAFSIFSCIKHCLNMEV